MSWRRRVQGRASMTHGVVPMCAGLLIVVAACAGGGGEDPSMADGNDSTSVATATMPTTLEAGMQLTSPAFEDRGVIPQRFTCDGADVSPTLALVDVPAEAVTLVLVMDDPDAPRGTWDHWLAYDIPVTDEVPEDVGDLGTPGQNSWGRTGYGGPCPPSGTHRYFFAVYALDASLGLDPGATKSEVLDAISGHVLAEAVLMGTYSRG